MSQYVVVHSPRAKAVRAQRSQSGDRLPRARPKSGGLHDAHGPELVENVTCRTLPLIMRPVRATIVNTPAGEGKASWCRLPFQKKKQDLARCLLLPPRDGGLVR